MTELGEAMQAAAATLPVWRDAAIAILAGIAILGLWLWFGAIDQ